MLFTVFTPTFNRAALLPRLYESLCRQTFRDFEWVIVDDGSTDNTAAVVDGFRGKENLFPIRYFRKVNGGKHTAINYGVQKASGELFLILDSDDELPMDSLNKIAEAWQSVASLPAKGKQIGGICGYMAHRDGTVIGHPTINGVADSIELRYIYGVTGDMCEVFRTMVLREFPFPEIQGEKFCPEVLVWNRIATKYTLKIFPEIIYLRDYLQGGLTDNITLVRMRSPAASMMTYSEMTRLAGIPFRARLRDCGRPSTTGVSAYAAGRPHHACLSGTAGCAPFCRAFSFTLMTFARYHEDSASHNIPADRRGRDAGGQSCAEAQGVWS